MEYIDPDVHPEHRYTAAELVDLPNLSRAQADDLKIDTGETRVWLCRCGIADGMTWEHTVSIEHLDPSTGRWENVAEYDGGALPTDDLEGSTP